MTRSCFYDKYKQVTILPQSTLNLMPDVVFSSILLPVRNNKDYLIKANKNFLYWKLCSQETLKVSVFQLKFHIKLFFIFTMNWSQSQNSQNHKMSSCFSPSQWSEIRKEFGIHCVRHRDFKKAKKYFEESLNFNAAKLDSVFLLTNTQSKEANTEDALELLNQVSVAQEGLCVEFSVFRSELHNANMFTYSQRLLI